MQSSSSRSPDEIENMVRIHSDMLFRISLVMLGNKYDAEDVLQETVIKYIQKAPIFNSPEHEKAWLIKVVTNLCRDVQRVRMKHPQISIDDLQSFVFDPESCGIIEALMTVPEKFRIVMLLYYVEEYRVEEIADIIGKSASAVKMRLKKGRKLLEEIYRKEYL
ncbi:MAG: RNA polymerase sigma factor [Candidatus Limivicinus sp.]